MTQPEEDDVFDAYLKRRSVLPGLDDKLSPPAALDEKVLARAREAIQSHAVGASPPAAANAGHDGASVDSGNVTSLGAAKRPMQRPPRWAVPVALAATVLLCLSVVMNISINRSQPSPNLERMSAARADVKASALANATSESDASAGVSARDALAANTGEPRESISGGIPSREVVIPRAKVAGAPAPHAPVVADAPGGTTESPAEADLSRPLAKSPPPAAPPVVADAPAGASKAVPPALSGAMASTGSASPVAPSARGGVDAVTRDEASDLRTDLSAADKAVLMAKDAGVAAPMGTPAPEAQRAAADRQAAKPAVVAPQPTNPSPMAAAPQPTNPSPMAAAPQPTNPSPMAAAPQPTNAPAMAAASQHQADPKVWLQQIDALRAAGKPEQADAEMRRFKAAFPHYAVPAAAAPAPDLPK
jgi:hypothetical protein